MRRLFFGQIRSRNNAIACRPMPPRRSVSFERRIVGDKLFRTLLGIGRTLRVRSPQENNGLVFAGDPFPHSLSKFGNRHGIPVAFVPDELVIPLGEKIKIALGCEVVFHGDAL